LKSAILFNSLNKKPQIVCKFIKQFVSLPPAKLAIQVSYSLRDEETRKRETEALQKLPRRLPCSHRIILTYDESDTITDEFGTIEVMPVWKWMLST
jgi:predicted AAA+ superfamily ATPase